MVGAIDARAISLRTKAVCQTVPDVDRVSDAFSAVSPDLRRAGCQDRRRCANRGRINRLCFELSQYRAEQNMALALCAVVALG
jgi:hypothetical protein